MAALAYFSFELEVWKNLNSLTKTWKRMYWFMKKSVWIKFSGKSRGDSGLKGARNRALEGL